jgi:hypothetical protein
VNGCPNPPHVPLFEIRGVPGTSYLRSSVGEVYRSGSWDILENSSRLDYQGGSIEQRISGYSKASYVKFSIAPLVEIGGFIPSVKNPLRLSLGDGQDIYYYPSQQLFFSKTGIRSDYDVEYVNYEFDERALTFASTPNDPRYLDVPSELLPALKPLAQKIVENYGAKTPYEKLKAIETYLPLSRKEGRLCTLQLGLRSACKNLGIASEACDRLLRGSLRRISDRIRRSGPRLR